MLNFLYSNLEVKFSKILIKIYQQNIFKKIFTFLKILLTLLFLIYVIFSYFNFNSIYDIHIKIKIFYK
jgi:hypothetical protein